MVRNAEGWEEREREREREREGRKEGKPEEIFPISNKWRGLCGFARSLAVVSPVWEDALVSSVFSHSRYSPRVIRSKGTWWYNLSLNYRGCTPHSLTQ